MKVSRGSRPHTKLQQRCLDAMSQLPPLTDNQRRYMERHITPRGYFITKGVGGRDSYVWCRCCGHVDRVKESPLSVSLQEYKSHTCSHCHKQLRISMRPHDPHAISEDNYRMAVVTECDGMQVVRMFNWSYYNALGKDTVVDISEVFQIWFDPVSLKRVTLTKSYTRSWYNFRWHTESHWRVTAAHHNKYSVYKDVYSLMDDIIYPHTKMLPVLKRNGWTHQMFNMAVEPVVMWKALIEYRDIEALVKLKQYKMVEYLVTMGVGIKEMVNILKICSRHGYIVDDASLYTDYIFMLKYFHKDTRSPHYLCPENLQQAHDRLLQKKRLIEKKEEMVRKANQAFLYEDKYKEFRGMYFGTQFGDGDIMVHVISSVKEMAEEGTTMEHCVFDNRYYSPKSHPNSLILSARNAAGERLATIEVSTKTWQIVQIRGKRNSVSPYHNDIQRIIINNMNILKQKAV